MAGKTEEGTSIQLDNAGNLYQSISTSLVLEKVLIVGVIAI